MCYNAIEAQVQQTRKGVKRGKIEFLVLVALRPLHHCNRDGVDYPPARGSHRERAPRVN